MLWTLMAALLASVAYAAVTQRWTVGTLTVPGVLLLATLVFLLFGSS